MKTKTSILTILFLAMLLFSCRNRNPDRTEMSTDFTELKDKRLTVQVMKVRQADSAGLSYQVRILPSKAWLANNGQAQNLNFFYHMDSCFSIKVEGSVFPAVIVLPVSNGMAGCYEYLLSFNAKAAAEGRAIELEYQDKFISGKKYSLQLKAN